MGDQDGLCLGFQVLVMSLGSPIPDAIPFGRRPTQTRDPEENMRNVSNTNGARHFIPSYTHKKKEEEEEGLSNCC